MDIINHALAGAAAGQIYGHPVIGAVVGVLPDTVLGLKRVAAPTVAYRCTHSLLFTLWVASTLTLVSPELGMVGLLASLSHLFLDLPTHGDVWVPRVLYPFSNRAFSFGEEWEWFNDTWWGGMLANMMWIAACLSQS